MIRSALIDPKIYFFIRKLLPKCKVLLKVYFFCFVWHHCDLLGHPRSKVNVSKWQMKKPTQIPIYESLDDP